MALIDWTSCTITLLLLSTTLFVIVPDRDFVASEQHRAADIFWEKARHDGIPVPVIRVSGGQRLLHKDTASDKHTKKDDGGGFDVASSNQTRLSSRSNASTIVIRSVLLVVIFWSLVMPRMKRWISACCRDASEVKRSMDARSRRRRSLMKVASLSDNRISTAKTVCIVVLLLSTPISKADRDVPADFFEQPIINNENYWQRLRKKAAKGKKRAMGRGEAANGIRIRRKIGIGSKSSILMSSFILALTLGMIRFLMPHMHGKRWISECCRYISEIIRSVEARSAWMRQRKSQKKKSYQDDESRNEQSTTTSSVMEIMGLAEDFEGSSVISSVGPSFLSSGGSSFLSLGGSSTVSSGLNSFLSRLSISRIRRRGTDQSPTTEFKSVESDMEMVDSSRPLSNSTRIREWVSTNKREVSSYNASRRDKERECGVDKKYANGREDSFSHEYPNNNLGKLFHNIEDDDSLTDVTLTHSHHPSQRRMGGTDSSEDDASHIPAMTPTDHVMRGYVGRKDDLRVLDSRNSALEKKLSAGSSRVRSRR